MDEQTLAALIASTARANPDNEGWFTAADFARDCRRGRDWASRRLAAAVASGQVVCERRTTTNVLGELASKPMYRAVKVKVGRK